MLPPPQIHHVALADVSTTVPMPGPAQGSLGPGMPPWTPLDVLIKTHISVDEVTELSTNKQNFKGTQDARRG